MSWLKISGMEGLFSCSCKYVTPSHSQLCYALPSCVFILVMTKEFLHLAVGLKVPPISLALGLHRPRNDGISNVFRTKKRPPLLPASFPSLSCRSPSTSLQPGTFSVRNVGGQSRRNVQQHRHTPCACAVKGGVDERHQRFLFVPGFHGGV